MGTKIDWQPISTLPKNRQRILASHWRGYCCDWVQDAEFKHGVWYHGLTTLTPTHWAPMPGPDDAPRAMTEPSLEAIHGF